METLASTANSLAQDFDVALRGLTRLVRHEADHGVSITSASVLSRLSDESLRVTELAALERVAQPTMTTLIGRLERRGLVDRRPAPDDGRAMLIELTDAGEEMLAGVRERRAAVLSQRLEQLSERDRRRIAAAIPLIRELTEMESR